MKKYITTTLPYINSIPHIGHCFEFCIADIITDFYRFKLGKDNVFLNVGVDEHGQKIYQKSVEEGYSNTQAYCDELSKVWVEFCKQFQIDYNNFYRTTDKKHKEQVLRYFHEIENNFYKKPYEGKYCVGCESFKTDKEIINNKCVIHNADLIDIEEENTFFPLHKFASQIKDILVNKSLSKEFSNLLEDDFDLSITRKNVKWGVELSDEETIYVWFEALLNYIFAVKYYEDKEYFNEYWSNSLQICGKDNLKFQSYILQAILLANDVPQTTELLVHGTILDENGIKMSKSLGNVIDPIEQKEKWGLSPLKYYLVLGLSLYDDSKYSEKELVNIWNSEVVNGLGNLISRTLHLIDIKNIDTNENLLSESFKESLNVFKTDIEKAFEEYNFNAVRALLNSNISKLNKRFQDEKPFDKNCTNYQEILNEIYFNLKVVSEYYTIVLKEHKEEIKQSFINKKKIILFQPLNLK
jgi:methionyl-tRNA synthetase